MMKRRLLGALLSAALLVLTLTIGTPVIASAAESYAAPISAYDFTIDSFDVVMKVGTDRKIDVTERIACSFSGYNSHGIIRDFPLDSGVLYHNIEAECDNPDFSPYTQKDDSSFLSLYLRGNGVVRGQTRTYTLRYEMTVPKLDGGYLPIDVLGFGWQTRIVQFSAEVTFPDGLEDFRLYSGRSGTQANELNAAVTRTGNGIRMEAEEIGYGQGITLDLQFEKGVLSASFDFSILYALGIGILLLGLIVLLSMRFCRQPILTATVNLEAPEEMDPLLMGKLIDNIVDSEDLGSLVFYLADRGYLAIDLSDEDDPLLIKKRSMDSTEPSHLRTFFDGLFSGRNRVRPSELKYKFYTVAQSTKAEAEVAAGKTYRGKGFLVLFGALTLLLLAGFSFVYPLMTVFSRYFYFSGVIACAASFLIAASGGYFARLRSLKWKKEKCAFLRVGTLVLAILPAILIFATVPCPAFGFWTGLILSVSAAAAGALSGGAIVRTGEYAAKLGQILGFKQFILYTERDKVEFMLKDSPELYYHILPYAQVLGVSDAWTEKFKGLDMNPPAYLSGYSSPDLFDYVVLSGVFRSMSISMAQTFVSRPSSSGGGVGGGSFGGGFGGGGFGGGGGRGC